MIGGGGSCVLWRMMARGRRPRPWPPAGAKLSSIRFAGRRQNCWRLASWPAPVGPFCRRHHRQPLELRVDRRGWPVDTMSTTTRPLSARPSPLSRKSTKTNPQITRGACAASPPAQAANSAPYTGRGGGAALDRCGILLPGRDSRDDVAVQRGGLGAQRFGSERRVHRLPLQHLLAARTHLRQLSSRRLEQASADARVADA